jgi:hypothetical protein
MLKARLNQPRESLEFLRRQEQRHRQASEEFFRAVRKGTLELGQNKSDTGATA